MSSTNTYLNMLLDWLLTSESDATRHALNYLVGILAFGAFCTAGWYCGDWLFECLKRRKE